MATFSLYLSSGGRITKSLLLGVLSVGLLYAASLSATETAWAQVRLSAYGVQTSVAAQPVSGRIIIRYKDDAVRTASGVHHFRTLSAASATRATKKLLSSTAVFTPTANLAYTKNVHPTMAVVRAKGITRRASLQALVQQIQQDPNVLFAEIDEWVRPLAVPNDTDFAAKQWNLKESAQSIGGANLPLAWDRATGEGVNIAVIDTGVLLNHPDLQGQLLPGFDFVSDTYMSGDGDGWDDNPDDPGDGYTAGYCTNINGDSASSSSSWHGTHVAGIVAAKTNNNLGIAGVAHGAKIIPIRALGKCGGNVSDVLSAMLWAAGIEVSGVPVNLNPAKVLNLSLGSGGSCSASMQETVNSVLKKNVAIVAATGNESNNSTIYFPTAPANCQGVIAVTSHIPDGTIAPYANAGGNTAISAPGGVRLRLINGTIDNSKAIYSTYNSGTLAPEVNGYAYLAGTSMATPHVAGVAAMMLQINPSATPARILGALRAGTKAFPLGSECASRVGLCGAGMLDAIGALDKVATDLPPEIVPIATPRVNIGQAVSFTVSAEQLGTGTITYSATGLPSGATFNSATGAFNWANPTTAGTYTVGFSATNAQGTGQMKSTTITVVASSTASTGGAGGSSGGGGGGCTVGDPTQRDGSLVLLAVLAILALGLRRRESLQQRP